MINEQMPKSRFSRVRGIAFAGDLETDTALFQCLDLIHHEIKVLKLGNALLYRYGFKLLDSLKNRYAELPVIIDIKLCDVAHIASRVAKDFAERGADVVVVAAICGPVVIKEIVKAVPSSCEIWVFSEFTHDSGYINSRTADESIIAALESGAKGVQAPGTRTHRVEEIREDVGENIAIMACGIGAQGARFGSAIKAGANFEIIGRSIYGQFSPLDPVREARRDIVNAEREYFRNEL